MSYRLQKIAADVIYPVLLKFLVESRDRENNPITELVYWLVMNVAVENWSFHLTSFQGNLAFALYMRDDERIPEILEAVPELKLLEDNSVQLH